MRSPRTFLAAAVTALLLAAAPAAAQADGVIEGHVTNARGAALAGVCVDVTTPDGPIAAFANTGPNGAWSASVPTGSYQIEFEGCAAGADYIPQYYPGHQIPEGGPPGLVTVTGGRSVGGVDATMQVGGRLTGSALDIDNGQPPSASDGYVELAAPGASDEVPLPVNYTQVDAAGGFTFSGLPSGTYLVGAAASFSSPEIWYLNSPDPGHSHPVQVVAGQTTRVASIGVGQGGSVTGVLRDRRGRPVNNMGVNADIVGPDGSIAVFGGERTDAAGHFTLAQLAPGNYTIAPKRTPRGNLPATAEATVTEGATATADIMLGRARQPTHLTSLRLTRRRRALRLAGRISDPGRVRGRVSLTFGPLVHRRTIRLTRLRFARGRFRTEMRLPRRYQHMRNPLLWIHVDGDRRYKPGTFCRALVPGRGLGCLANRRLDATRRARPPRTARSPRRTPARHRSIARSRG